MSATDHFFTTLNFEQKKLVRVKFRCMGNNGSVETIWRVPQYFIIEKQTEALTGLFETSRWAFKI